MNNPKYDQFGGITDVERKVGGITPARIKIRKGYNFLERLLIKRGRKINYLLDENGKYKCRRQKFPQVIRIGITNRCAARCVYCPREYIHDKGNGYMDFALYEKIIRWAEEHGVEAISFALFGEPLLHPRILEIIDLAHRSGLRMRISTNCIPLKKELADKLLEYPFESFETSMDGFMREEYLAGKHVDAFQTAKENIIYLLDRAREKKSEIKFNIHFVDVGHISFLNKLRYIRYWKKKLKGLSYLTSFYYEPHNWAGARSDIRNKMNFFDAILAKWEFKKPCVYLKGLNINWNGDALVCCNNPFARAVLGNINEEDMEKIYNGEKRLSYLSEHEKGTFKDLDCAVCTVNSVMPLSYLKKRILRFFV